MKKNFKILFKNYIWFWYLVLQINLIFIKMDVSNTCEYARQFVKIYYEKLDKSRSTFEKLYHDKANLVWNGNKREGKENIFEFYNNLPISETNLTVLDAQPVSKIENFESTQMILITCFGTIRFNNVGSKTFTQCFMLIAEPETDKIVWKIISDTFKIL